MDKYIHYCWFGGKKMPRKFKKYIKTWKRFLPDYKIMEWNENNFDISFCNFSKEAYENKKWAFVADYVRTKALYEYGGIYMDTDMEIISNLSEFLDKNLVLGLEDSKLPNAAIVIVKDKHNKYIKKLLDRYRNSKFNETGNLHDIAIPNLLNDLLLPYGLDNELNEIQVLDNNIFIYPREYFYPYSFDMKNNVFTNNTKTIHHFSASWLSYFEKRDIFIERNKLTKFRDFIIIPSTVFCFGALFLAKTKVIKIDDNTKKRYRDNIWSNKLIHRKEK
jgi:hypothetical protein